MTGTPKLSARTAACALLIGFAATFPVTGIVAEHSEGSTARAETTDARDVKREWSEALESLKHYSVDQRDEAVAKAESLLDTIDLRIDRLDSRVRDEWSEMSESVRQQRTETLRAMRQQRNDLSEWLGGMKQSSATAWERIKDGFIDAYTTLGDSFDQALQAYDNDAEGHSQSRDKDAG